MTRSWRAVALVFASLLLPSLAAAQEQGAVDPEAVPRPDGFATRIATEISIDGRLDEAAWSSARPITEFVQSIPRTGSPATEKTLVRILYDEKNLYVGAICYESEPNRITVTSLERDFQTLDSDVFGISLDTFLDRRNGFIFWFNPYGAIRDAQAFDDSRTRNDAWDGILDVGTTVADSGWVVEIAIPWTTLRFNASQDQQTWGLNLNRRIRRKNEDVYWSPLEQREYIHKMSRAGTLHGLEDIRSGRNFLLKPYVMALRGTGSSLAEADTGNSYDGGLDLKYGITPRMTLDLTYRTDFSQVEVDREQVNLTRFPLFFPEQRDFFLENSGTFTFGDLRGMSGDPRTGVSLSDFSLFHSRQIGLSGGRPVPMEFGGRLTGSLGSNEIGLLNVQTGAFDEGPAENFSVVRVRRKVLSASDIGFLFGNRQATSDGGGDYNRSFGVDANMRPLRNLVINSYFALTRSSEGDDDEAARVSVGWRDRLWDTSVLFRYLGNDFDPGVGYVRRAGIRQYYATFGAHPRPDIPLVMTLNPYVEGHYITNLDGLLETRTGEIGLGATLLDGSRLNLQFTDNFEHLESPFRVGSETVPAGDYSFREASASYSSSGGRALSGDLSVSGGGYYGGTRSSISTGVTWRADYHLSFELSATHNALEIQGNRSNADLFSARVKYSYSTKLYARGYVQYNKTTGQLITNIRLNYIHAPLSDFFIVYTERRDVSTGGGILERFITAKFTKLFAF